MTAVHPDERDRCADEVKKHVGEPERRGGEGNRLERLLDPALDVHAGGLLQRNDVGGVLPGRLDVLATGAAHHLVEAVEKGDCGDLPDAGVGA